MPIIKSAKKAMKRSLVLRERNQEFKLRMKMAIKKFIKSVSKGEAITQDNLNSMYKIIDKCCKIWIIKKKTAARKKSRIARLFNSLSKK